MKDNYLSRRNRSAKAIRQNCNQISDAVLDAYLASDPVPVWPVKRSSTGLIVVAGESLDATVDLSVARRRRMCYDDGALGFDYKSCGLIQAVGKQSPDIAVGVNEGEGLYAEQGAGDRYHVWLCL